MRTRVLYIQTYSLSTGGARKPGPMAFTSSTRYQLSHTELLCKRQHSKPRLLLKLSPISVPTLQPSCSIPTSNSPPSGLVHPPSWGLPRRLFSNLQFLIIYIISPWFRNKYRQSFLGVSVVRAPWDGHQRIAREKIASKVTGRWFIRPKR